MEVISSLENKKIKNVCKLNMKKYRDIENKFIVTLEHLVLEADKNGYLLEVICLEGYDKKFDVPTTYVTEAVMKKITGMNSTQGVVGICKKMEHRVNNLGNKILILDDVQDPGNLGTIIRSSVAFGVDTICVSYGTVDMYNDKVLRASEGMIFNINIIEVDIRALILKLQDEGYTVFGTKVTNGESVKNIDVPSKLALVMGNEGAGVSSDILEYCDKYLYIPMSDKCESLNVGVATSILLYELGDK